MPTPVDWPTQDLISHRAASTPERTALIDAETGESRTFRDLDTTVDRRAAAIERAAGPSPTVGTLLDTRLAFVETVFAVQRLGGRLVPLNVRLTAAELATQTASVGLELLVCEADTEATAVEVTEAPVASVDEPAHEQVDALTAPAAEAREPVDLDHDSDAVILFTSGTTGDPKGVRLTLGNLLASATASAFRLGVTPEDRWLCCLPMYHMGGLAPVVRSALYGTTAVVQPDFELERVETVFEEYGITGVSLVPTMLTRLLDDGWTPPETLRFVLLGGAPASGTLIDRCERAGVPVYPTYGMTETASQVSTATPQQAFSHDGTVGQPLVCTDVAVVDEDGNPCDPGQPGELVVSGPTVTPGYLDDETTGHAVDGRGLYTGDIGHRDADGRLWVHNRKDDRIITGGENVDPGEVVAVLRTHSEIVDAAVVGIDDPEWGERVGALVVPHGGATLDPEAIESYCRERLAGFKLPRTVAVVDGLPRTASGTVDRRTVRERLRDAGDPDA